MTIILLALSFNGTICHGDAYFPKNTFSDFEHSLFAGDLRAMREPSLYSANNTADQSYRFMNLPSFSDRVCVRVDKNKKGYQLTVKRLKGPGKNNRPLTNASAAQETLEQKTVRTISKKDWVELLQHIKAANFWSLQNHDATLGMDGTTWVIEGRKKGTYHAITRWSPSRGQVYVLGAYIAKLAGIKLSSGK